MQFLYFYHMNTYFYGGFKFSCMFMFFHWNNCGVWKYSADLNCPLKQQNISARKSVQHPSYLEIKLLLPPQYFLDWIPRQQNYNLNQWFFHESLWSVCIYL